MKDNDDLEDLLKRLLVKEFKNRITMKDFLAHRYTRSTQNDTVAQATQQVANLSMTENKVCKFLRAVRVC